MTTYTDISTRAMLVSFNVSTWTAKKFDKKATAQVTDANDATSKAGRFNKDLLAGAQLHKRVIQLADAARQLHYQQTLPWADSGARMLPTANYQTYTDTMRKARDEFEPAVAEFIAEYPQLREAAKRELGDLWRADDYPPVNELRARFTWTITLDPIPRQGDLRIELPADEIASIEARIAERSAEATRAAMVHAWERLREAVDRIAKATQEKGVIRDNLVEHARNVAELLGRLNVSNDHDLETMRKRVLRDLARYDVETLREDKDVRATTKAKADSILDAMAGFFPQLSRVDAA